MLDDCREVLPGVTQETLNDRIRAVQRALHANGHPDWRKRFDPRKKIAILGNAPDSMQEAPFDDDTWQIWAINHCDTIPRWEAAFELHDWPFQAESEYRQWLCQPRGKPMVLNAQRDEVPDCLAYPWDEVRDPRVGFGDVLGRYLTNTVSEMMALAIMLEPTDIGVWGVNMAESSEYGGQRPSCEAFIGYAICQGINVHIPPQSDLMKCSFVYGHETSFLVDKLDAFGKESADKLAQAKMETQRVSTIMAELRGQQTAIQYMRALAGKYK